MKLNPRELHSERLATADSDGKRISLYPLEVSGKWEKLRTKVYLLLISIYMILPWTKINGMQSFLIDIPNREFFIFGTHFYAHDVPLLFIIITIFLFLIGLITAIMGRVWCGWACPQTVFIEGVFRKIELFIEGNSRKRMHLDEAKMSFEKFFRKFFKWTVFLIVSIIISHSFLAYFVRVEELIKIVQIGPKENYTLFLTMLLTSGIFLFDFGWFREQFCIIACPYGRMQSVLMDKDSLIVAYDTNRGEPRKTTAEKEHADCIDCYKCVQVCPTGIDIRRGTQLECIHCTRCIDICNDVMEHIGKPKGLIRYSTEKEIDGEKTNFKRPRVILYSVVLLLLIFVGGTLIYKSKNVQVLLLRGSRSPYQVVVRDNAEKIVNHYKAEFFYRGSKKIDLSFKTNNPQVDVVSPVKGIILEASRKKVVHIFFKFQRNILEEGSRKIKITIFDKENEITSKEVTLVGPYK